MKYFFLLLLPLFLFSKSFNVASYNVENLFDDHFQGTEYNDYIPGKHNWTSKMVELKLDHVAEVICDLNADILALQEIENSLIFERLIKRLKRVGCAYRYAEITSKKGAPIQVALLSRFPIKEKRELRVSYSPYTRNILEIEVDVHGKPLTLFVNHWKSKGRNGVESKRIKYAKRLKKRIDAMPPTKEYLILGDLNSHYNAHRNLKKRLNDTQGLTGINHVLKTVKNSELLQKYEMLKEGKGVHFNPWQELPYKKRWSHKYYGNRGTLDHILLPQSMFDGKGLDYVNHSFSVFKAPYLFTKKGYINNWQYKNGKHRGKGYSDHLPVLAMFDDKAYVASKNESVTTTVLPKSIEYLYSIDTLEQPVELKDAVVVLKRGKYAVVKQIPKGRGIFLFGSVNGLKEGSVYDIKVQEIYDYKGLKEITALEVIKEKGKVALETFYQTLEINRQSEVLRDLIAVYKNKHLIVNGQKIPVYFKNKKLTPKNGSKLKIHYAHLGYYKKLQLVIYSKKDFTVLNDVK